MQDIDNNMKVCFITAFEDYNDEFRQSFPQLDEAKCFVRKPKAIEDLVKTCSNNSRIVCYSDFYVLIIRKGAR